jgi:hypothetical protein
LNSAICHRKTVPDKYCEIAKPIDSHHII